MTDDAKPRSKRGASKGKPKPPDIEVKVVNPRYEGATVEMVVKAMLQRPKKDKKADKGNNSETS